MNKTLLLPETRNDDTEALFNLIEESNKTGVPIDESVFPYFVDNHSARLLLACRYTKERDLNFENDLYVSAMSASHDNRGGWLVLPYIKYFKIKEGKAWDAICEKAELATLYAQVVISGRFIEGEKAILSDSECNKSYVEFLRTLSK
jgi:hypothetical protein